MICEHEGCKEETHSAYDREYGCRRDTGLCQSHWEEHVTKWTKMNQKFDRRKRVSDRIGWLCAAALFAVGFYSQGTVVTLLTLIAGLLFYIALRRDAR
jgi:hypothetical protein